MGICATCKYWVGDDSAYRADCGLPGNALGATTFDASCPQWTEKPGATKVKQGVAYFNPATAPPAPSPPLDVGGWLDRLRATLAQTDDALEWGWSIGADDDAGRGG